MSPPPFRSTVDRIISSVATLGIVDGLLYLVARSIGRLSRNRCKLIKYQLVAQPIPKKPVTVPETQVGFRVFRIAAGDPLVAVFPRPTNVNQQRFAQGAQCFVACKQERFVGHIWISRGRYIEDEVRCVYVLDPPDLAVWDFDVYVEPAYRAGRAFARLWDGVNETLFREGFRWTLSRISAFNASSFRAHKRLGLVSLHSALFLCIGGAQFSLLTCRPYVHVSWSPKQCPIVRLRVPQPAVA